MGIVRLPAVLARLSAERRKSHSPWVVCLILIVADFATLPNELEKKKYPPNARVDTAVCAYRQFRGKLPFPGLPMIIYQRI
jgi:hypothetical protein